MDEKKKLKRAYGPTHSTAAKTVAFIMCILMLIVSAASVAGAAIMWGGEVYGYSEDYLLDRTYEDVLESYVFNTLFYLDRNSTEPLRGYLEQTNIGRVVIKGAGYDIDLTVKPSDSRYEYSYSRIKRYGSSSTGDFYWSNTIITEGIYEENKDNIVTVTFTVASELGVPDVIYWSNIAVTVLYALRFWIYPIGALALIIAVICFVFLMSAAGKRKGILEVTPSNLTKVPFEIPTFLFLSVILCCIGLISEIWNDFTLIIAVAVSSVILTICLIFWLMSLAIRIKLGTLIKNTIIYRILKYIGISIRVIWRSNMRFIKSIPVVWKTLLAAGICFLAEFLSMVLFLPYNTFLFIVLWVLTRIFLGICIVLIAAMLKTLQKGGKEIASGNFEHKIDTTYLVLDFKTHGEDLNRIGEGINIAVDERMKSERMKTELITNVSHDIKTPLTSIINYSDLICREECDNEKISEYAGILHNQSERMKRLIDDLVEASKAQSGNIDIALAECDARVLVSQAAGEYAQRLADAGLDLVCTAPENEVRIMADGRRIWRVFDNLMNNARKYALPGTRVYLSLEEIGGRAVFKFKNISREPLSVDASELSERFVRGDASRNTEGNGLGLSIAKSLTELQGGDLDITSDGDLFKVTLSFPKVK